jgi:ribosomal protein S14
MVNKEGKSKSGSKGKRANKADAGNAETAPQREASDEELTLLDVVEKAAEQKSKVGRCPQCGSTQGYTQLTTGAWICRKCGKATLMDGTVVDAKELIRKK